MREIVYSKKYKNDMKRMIKQGVDMCLHDDLVNMLCEDAKIPDKHKDHELRGEWKGFRDLHITSNWLLIYRLTDESLMLARTGSHAEVFGN